MPRWKRLLILLRLTTLNIILWPSCTFSTEKWNQNLRRDPESSLFAKYHVIYHYQVCRFVVCFVVYHAGYQKAKPHFGLLSFSRQLEFACLTLGLHVSGRTKRSYSFSVIKSTRPMFPARGRKEVAWQSKGAFQHVMNGNVSLGTR